jgi:hypothetical protein
MKLEGGCYCGAVRYLAEGEPTLMAQCHCRECQYITGGSPNVFLAMLPEAFKYTKGAPKQFARKDLEKPVTREFCAECGTHMVTRPQRPIVVIKVGTLDDPPSSRRRWRSTPATSRRSTMCRRACRRSSGCLKGGHHDHRRFYWGSSVSKPASDNWQR